MSFLTLNAVTKSFGANTVVENFNFAVEKGEFISFLGPSGCGKTTVLRMIAGFETPSDGRITIDGQDVTDVPASRLAALGLRRAFQQNAFFTDMTVLDNMISVIQPSYGTGLLRAILRPVSEYRRAAQARDFAVQALIDMGIGPEFHDRLPGEIPYGTQRMLSIALANGTGARILLLDEPAAGLGGDDMRRLCDRLLALRAAGMAIVIIEHHMDLIMQITDRIVVLDRGRLLAYGTPAKIRSNPAVLEAYLGRDA